MRIIAFINDVCSAQNHVALLAFSNPMLGVMSLTVITLIASVMRHNSQARG